MPYSVWVSRAAPLDTWNASLREPARSGAMTSSPSPKLTDRWPEWFRTRHGANWPAAIEPRCGPMCASTALCGSFKLLPRLRALIHASPRVPPDHWFIPYLAVTTKHRGNGVAHALLDSVYQRAAVPCIGLQSVCPGPENQQARRFYEHAGFREARVRIITTAVRPCRHSRACEAGAGILGRSDLAAESDKPTPPGYGRPVRSQSRYQFFDSSEYTWLGSR